MRAEKRIPKQGEVYRALASGWMLYRNQQQHPPRWSVSVAPAELVLVGGLCVRWRMALYWGGAHPWGRAIDSLFASSATAKDKRWAISTSALCNLLQFYLSIFFPVRLFVNAADSTKKVKGKKACLSILNPPQLPHTHTGFRLRAPLLSAVVIILLPFQQTQI